MQPSKSNIGKKCVMTKSDIVILVILCSVFAFLVFFKLGNTKAPETVYSTKNSENPIILDFGEVKHIDNLYVYLGNLHNRQLYLSFYDSDEGPVTYSEDIITVPKVFQWNEVSVDYDTRFIAINTLSDEAVFCEFVFTDSEGNILTPTNTADCKELFDEQDCFFTNGGATYMDGTIFDEIYHGRTGYEFVHGLTTYETTHPQLGKCLIALGIKIFGMTPFGMRVAPAIFGLLLIPYMYLFAKRLFKSTFVASLVGTLVTFDSLHYTLSRIATIDMIVAFFIVASYYYMYKYIVADKEYRKTPTADKFPPKEVYLPLAACGIMVGLAVSVKLTGVFAGAGLAVILCIHLIKYPPKKQTFRLFLFCVLFYIVFTLAAYVLAYIPFVENTAGKDLTDTSISFENGSLSIGYGNDGLIAKTIRNTEYMFNYHSHLNAEHIYASPFYLWPISQKMLCASFSRIDSGQKTSEIIYMGNQSVWFVEIPCIIFMFVMGIKSLIAMLKNIFSKEKKEYDIIPLFLTVAYLAQYMPWFFVSRITFIYHYFPSALFGMIIVGYTADKILKRFPKAKSFIYIYLGIVILNFFITFPITSGIPFPSTYFLFP